MSGLKKKMVSYSTGNFINPLTTIVPHIKIALAMAYVKENSRNAIIISILSGTKQNELDLLLHLLYNNINLHYIMQYNYN